MSAGNVKSVSQPSAVPRRPLLTVGGRNLWRTVSYHLLRALLYLLLIGVGITMLLPLLWMISTSLKQPGEVFLLPPKWIPNPPQWSNYIKLFEVLPFGRFLFNSLKISVLPRSVRSLVVPWRLLPSPV